MGSSVNNISLLHLSLAFIPVAVVIFMLWRWNQNPQTAIYAVIRMLIQLLLIGYVLGYIFEAKNAIIVVAVLSVMLFASALIALRTMREHRTALLLRALLSILIGGGLVLALITQWVLELNPWFMPSYMIPLAGMIFANSMNAVSLAGERLSTELKRGGDYTSSRNQALQAALIPITNSLFAVGLVSLPGMMTGQILSGVSPLIAARYQIMVMCMIFGSTGISAILFLSLTSKYFQGIHER